MATAAVPTRTTSTDEEDNFKQRMTISGPASSYSVTLRRLRRNDLRSGVTAPVQSTFRNAGARASNAMKRSSGMAAGHAAPSIDNDLSKLACKQVQLNLLYLIS
jgi:hypothetical protein